MNFADFQAKAHQTCTDSSWSPAYLRPGLCSEAGEACGHIAKMVRGDYGFADLAYLAAMEVGDGLWFSAEWAKYNGLDLSGIELLPATVMAPTNDIEVLEGMARSACKTAGQFAEWPVMDCLTAHLRQLENLASALGHDMEAVGRMVLAKLHVRQMEGKIKGSGDRR